MARQKANYFRLGESNACFDDNDMFVPGARVLALTIPVDEMYAHKGKGLIGNILNNEYARSFLQLIQLFGCIAINLPVGKFDHRDGEQKQCSAVFLEAITPEDNSSEVIAFVLYIVLQKTKETIRQGGANDEEEKKEEEEKREDEPAGAGGEDGAHANNSESGDDERKVEQPRPARPARPAPRKNVRPLHIPTFGDIVKDLTARMLPPFLKRDSRSRSTNEAFDEDKDLLFQRFNSSYYATLCDAYLLEDNVSRTTEEGLLSLNQLGNPVNPERVFSIRNSRMILRVNYDSASSPHRGKIPRRLLKASSYYDEARGTFRFPHTNVWRLPLEDMHPDVLQKTYFPVTRPRVLNQQQAQRIAQRVNDLVVAKRRRVDPEDESEPVEEESEDDEIPSEQRRAETAAYIARIFEQTGRPPGTKEGSHLTFMSRYKARYEREIKPLWRAYRFTEDPDQRKDAFEAYSAAYSKFQKEGLDELDEVFTVSDEIPSAFKALTNWKNTYTGTTEKVNFFFNVPYKYKNLSVFGNNVVLFSEEMEAAFALESLHNKSFLIHIAILDVYRFARDHPHILHFGDHATGKGYLMINVESRLLINGTYTVLDSSSEQAYHDGTCEQSYQVMMCEEMQARKLGVGDKPGADSSTMDSATAFKNQLTSNMLRRRVTVMRDDNSRRCISIDTEANHLWYGGTNAKLSRIDPPIRSRFLTAYEKTTRLSDRRRNMSNLVAAPNETAEFDSYVDCYTTLSRSIQYVLAHLQLAIDANVLPSPDLSLFDRTSDKIIRDASQLHLPNIEEIREFGRVRTILRSLVLHNAVFTYLTSPCHSDAVRNEPWSVQHLARIMPYAVCTVEMVVFVYGCFCETYRNPLRTEILRFIAEKVLPVDPSCDTPAKVREYRARHYSATWQPVRGCSYEPMDDYYVIYKDQLRETTERERQRQRGGGDEPAQIIEPTTYPSIGNSKKSAWATLCDFANVIADDNNSSPFQARTVLNDMKRECVEKRRRGPDNKTEKYKVPLLRIRKETNESQIWIERSMIDELRNDTIVDIAWRTMSHLVPRNGRYLSGSSDKATPFVYNVVDVKVKPKASVRLRTGDSVNPEVRKNAELTAIANGFGVKRARGNNYNPDNQVNVYEQFKNAVMRREFNDESKEKRRMAHAIRPDIIGFDHSLLDSQTQFERTSLMLDRLGISHEDRQYITPSPFATVQMEEIEAIMSVPSTDPNIQTMRECMRAMELEEPLSRQYPDGYKKAMEKHGGSSKFATEESQVLQYNEDTKEMEEVTDVDQMAEVIYLDNGLVSKPESAPFPGPVLSQRQRLEVEELPAAPRRFTIQDDSARQGYEDPSGLDESDGYFPANQARDLMRQVEKDEREGLVSASEQRPAKPRNFFSRFLSPSTSSQFGNVPTLIRKGEQARPSRVPLETSDNFPSPNRLLRDTSYPGAELDSVPEEREGEREYESTVSALPRAMESRFVRLFAEVNLADQEEYESEK